MTNVKPPKLFRVRTAEDLDRIPFENGMAAVEVPAELLPLLDLKHETRGESLRLEALERSIRQKGFQPIEPITARIGRKGRWVVVNGGHRITAARNVMREFWTNLFGKKVESLYFILFTNPESWSKRPPPPGVEVDRDTGEGAAEMRESWDRADARMRALQNQGPRN